MWRFHWWFRSSSASPPRTYIGALDRQKYVWVRSKDRVDYRIPLPIKSGSSSQFFPDFLWWVKKTIWALDTTGKFILHEKVRTKLLIVPSPLRIGLVVRGHLDATYKTVDEDGRGKSNCRKCPHGPYVYSYHRDGQYHPSKLQSNFSRLPRPIREQFAPILAERTAEPAKRAVTSPTEV